MNTTSVVNETPRVKWEKVGNWQRISANKALLLLNPKTWSVDIGTISETDGDDPRGELWDLDHTKRLNWDDYLWYSYACLPDELYHKWTYEAQQKRQKKGKWDYTFTAVQPKDGNNGPATGDD